MGDGFDLINYVELTNLRESSRLQNERYQLDKRMDYIKERFGVMPEPWHVFNRNHPPRTPDGMGTRLLKWTPLGAAVGAAVGLALGLIGGPVALFTAGAGALWGAAVGAIAAVFHDPSPTIQREQTKKYENYLTRLEEDLSMGRAPRDPYITPREFAASPDMAAAPESTRFREQVAAEQAARAAGMPPVQR